MVMDSILIKLYYIMVISYQLSRVPSMPELWGGFLLCDLGLTSRKNSTFESISFYKPFFDFKTFFVSVLSFVKMSLKKVEYDISHDKI